MLMKVTRSPTATVISDGLTPLGRITTVGSTGPDGVGVGAGAIGVGAAAEDEFPPQATAAADSAIVTSKETSFRVR